MVESPQKKFTDAEVIAYLKKRFPDAFEKLDQLKPGVISVRLSARKHLLKVSKCLKTELNFNYPLSVSALDWTEHFEVVYHIVSYDNNNLIEIHLTVPKEDPTVMSLVRVWKGVNAHEREAYDMMGIIFQTHPDLRRILLPDDVDYYPLRKDFPLGGQKDPNYNPKPKDPK